MRSQTGSASVVGRLAPSPTGRLHLGHARTFALAWAHVRSRSGRLLLRFDDLDETRSRPRWADAALRDLEWLGLDWDGPATSQAAGLDRLRMLAESLVGAAAYACVCTRADLRTAVSAPHLGARQSRYPGTCRDRFSSLAEARAQGERVAVRLRVPPGTIRFTDGIFGPSGEDVADVVGDFALLNRMGTPSYQFATAIDDAHQGITEVFRGEDLLASTARQVAVLRAVGLPEPRWFHVPLVTDEHGRRLAKRADDLSLAELRERGVDPHAVIGWIGQSAGFWTGARATSIDLCRDFDLARLSRSRVRTWPGQWDST